MGRIQHLDRRSFLRRVAGGALAAGGALLLVHGAAPAQPRRTRMAVDADPGDPARTGLSDADSGGNADPRGDGRGGAAARRRGVTDADRGPHSDPPRRGRGPARPPREAMPPSPPPPPADPTFSGGRPPPVIVQPPVGGGAPAGRFVICPGNRRCPRR